MIYDNPSSSESNRVGQENSFNYCLHGERLADPAFITFLLLMLPRLPTSLLPSFTHTSHNGRLWFPPLLTKVVDWTCNVCLLHAPVIIFIKTFHSLPPLLSSIHQRWKALFSPLELLWLKESSTMRGRSMEPEEALVKLINGETFSSLNELSRVELSWWMKMFAFQERLDKSMEESGGW